MINRLIWCAGFALFFAFPSSINAQQRDVQVTLSTLEVHDDCDEITAGDWFVALRAMQSGAPQDRKFVAWPNLNEAADVDTGSTVRVDRSITLHDVPVTNQVILGVDALDCDAESASIPGFALVPLFPLIPEGGPRPFAGVFNCDGEEEVFELSGNNDHVGSGVLELTWEEWNQGGRFTLQPSNSEQCSEGGINLPGVGPAGGIITEPGGSKAYTAVIDIMPGEVVVDGSLIIPAITLPIL